MDLKLEVVVVPVTDADRAKDFYVGKLGFHLDADIQPGSRGVDGGSSSPGQTEPTPGMRVVHMTPPGSACSVVVGPVVVSEDADLGSGARFQLVVTDIEAARAELRGRGVEVSEVETLDPRDGGKFAYFSDPDGNNWAVQEIRERVGAELG
jgi:catechol 2,3-dioxygenase-like lactoylglutathione lyase family enzyme